MGMRTKHVFELFRQGTKVFSVPFFWASQPMIVKTAHEGSVCAATALSADSECALLLQAAEIFRPGRITVSLSVNEDLPTCKWVEHLRAPRGYSMQGNAAQRFGCGGCVFHYNLALAEKAGDALPNSPSTVLENIFGSMSYTGGNLETTLLRCAVFTAERCVSSSCWRGKTD